MKLKSLIIFISTTLLLFSGCSDLSPKNIEEEDTNQFAMCSMDTDAVGQIMTEDIGSDLECLRYNLNLFISIVKTDRKGFLSQKRLHEFIDTNMKDIPALTLDILDGAFDMNALLFGDEPGYISQENVDRLVDSFKEFNTLLVENNIFELFTDNANISFSEHNERKAVIYSAFSKMSELITKYVVPNDNRVPIASVLAKFKNLKNKERAEQFGDLLFIKKLFLGGDTTHLTSRELIRAVNLLGDAGKIAFDFIHLPHTLTTSTSQEEKVFKILKEDLLSVHNRLYFKERRDEPIIPYDHIENLVKEYFPSIKKYLVYKDLILKVKEIFLGSSREIFTSGDFETLIYDVFYKNISKAVFFYKAYDFNSWRLNGSSVILNDFSNLRQLVSTPMEEDFMQDFNRIIKGNSKTSALDSKGYKYIQGTDYIPLYDLSYQRNPRGIFEVSAYEYLVENLFKHFGSYDGTVLKNYYMSLEQFEVMLETFSNFLGNEGLIIEERSAATAETVTLISTLFHPSSNGDDKIEVNEFVEFLVTLRAALKMGIDMQKFLTEKCEGDKQVGISPECYRNQFMTFLNQATEETDNIKRSAFLPKLTGYLENLEPEVFDEYLQSASNFSRACTYFDDGTEVPMKFGDFVVSWSGLLAVEQSMLTFDTNKSGILEFREVNIAYDVYQSAVRELIPEGFMRRYTKDIFFYMVKYKRAPDIPKVNGLRSLWAAARAGGHLAQFILRPQAWQKSTADRMTFAKVLEIIKANSPQSVNNPLDCEKLRGLEM